MRSFNGNLVGFVVRDLYGGMSEKTVNYSHLFPTRYSVELEGLKGVVASETFKEPSQREDAKKQVKKLLEERYTSGKNKWFFQPLRVRPFTVHRSLLHFTLSHVSLSPCFARFLSESFIALFFLPLIPFVAISSSDRLVGFRFRRYAVFDSKTRMYIRTCPCHPPMIPCSIPYLLSGSLACRACRAWVVA